MTKMEIKGFSDSDKLDELFGQEFFFEKKTNEINSEKIMKNLREKKYEEGYLSSHD